MSTLSTENMESYESPEGASADVSNPDQQEALNDAMYVDVEGRNVDAPMANVLETIFIFAQPQRAICRTTLVCVE